MKINNKSLESDELNAQQLAWQALAKINEQSLHPGALGLTIEALSMSKVPPSAKILDIGCGTGKSLQYLLQHGYQAIGLDLSLDLLLADSLPVIQADMQNLPFEEASFELLLYECTLSLASNKFQALHEAKRILQNKGKVIISDIFVRSEISYNNLNKQNNISEQSFCSQAALHLEDLKNILEHLGFLIVYEQDYTKALKELAAKLVWHYGSTEALFATSQRACQSSVQNFSPSQTCSQKLDYKLIIAEKR